MALGYLNEYRTIKNGETAEGQITASDPYYSPGDNDTVTGCYEGWIYKAVYWNSEHGREIEAECSYAVKKHSHRIGDTVTIVPLIDKPEQFMFAEDESCFHRKYIIYFH